MANCLKSRIYIRLEPPDWEALWYLGCDPEVIRLRFERRTHSLEGCCSIQLSYRTIFFKSVAKVRQFIENSNNLPKFFIRKLRQNLSNSLK